MAGLTSLGSHQQKNNGWKLPGARLQSACVSPNAHLHLGATMRSFPGPAEANKASFCHRACLLGWIQERREISNMPSEIELCAERVGARACQLSQFHFGIAKMPMRNLDRGKLEHTRAGWGTYMDLAALFKYANWPGISILAQRGRRA